MKPDAKTTQTNNFSLLIFEFPFWLVFSYCSILPDTQTLRLNLEGIPVILKDIIIIPIACLYLLLFVINKNDDNSLNKPWSHHLFIMTLGLLIYAAVSIEESGMDARNTRAMNYTLMLTASSFFLAYSLIVKKNYKSVRSFLWRLTVCLAALGLLYSIASFFSVGLGDVRSDLNAGDSDFGILRVRGPLFPPSTGHFILLPALAFSIQELIQSKTKRLFKFSVALALTFTVIGLGSRAALIIFAIFLVFLILAMKNKKQARKTVLVMIVVVLTAIVPIYSKASMSRFQSLDDSTRLDTHLTSFHIITQRSAELNFTGSGYGSYWPWYLTDMEEVNSLDATPTSLVYPFGLILYHPHSTFLLLIVELGSIGLFYFLYLWNILVRLLFENRKLLILNAGITASGFSMFFDFILFKGVQVNAIWWLYLLGTLALNDGCDLDLKSKKS